MIEENKIYYSCEICGRLENDHKQRHISYEKINACVDEKIAEIILFCWKNNIETQFSCIGTDCSCDDAFCYQEATQILFWQAKDLQRFLLLVRKELYKDWLLELCFDEPYHPSSFSIFESLAPEDSLNYKSKREIKVHYFMSDKIPDSKANEDGKVEGISIPSEKHREYIRWNFQINRDMIERLNRVLSRTMNLDMSILVKNADESNFGLIVNNNGNLSFYGGFKNGIDSSINFERKSLMGFSVENPGLDIEKMLTKIAASNEKLLKEVARPGGDLLKIINLIRFNGLFEGIAKDGSRIRMDKSIHILRGDEILSDDKISELNFYYNNWQDEGKAAKYFFSK
jgi:hypothetical protein